MITVMNMFVSGVRHDWPEKAGFCISRPEGLTEYTFLHFTTAVQLKIGNKTIHSRPGACIFYAPSVPQWFYSPQDMIHNWIHTDISLSTLLEQYEIPQNRLLYPSNTAFISEIFRKIEMEFFSDNPHKEALIESYIKEFIIKFSRALQSNTPPTVVNRKDRDKLRAVRQKVLSQPEKKWTIAEMAALASLSPSRFHAVYKSLFGTSPLQDVIEAKIGYAGSLLLSDEQLTLLAVAEKLGYTDQYHFIRQFKAVTGETPGCYRKTRR